jgi:hypothetical protein
MATPPCYADVEDETIAASRALATTSTMNPAAVFAQASASFSRRSADSPPAQDISSRVGIEHGRDPLDAGRDLFVGPLAERVRATRLNPELCSGTPRPALEVASLGQLKVMSAIEGCRTARLPQS